MFISVDMLSIPGAQEIVEDGEYGIFIPYHFNLSRYLDKNGKERRSMILDMSSIEPKDGYYKLKLRVPNEDKDEYFFSRAAAKSRIVGIAVRQDANASKTYKDDFERYIKDLGIK